MEPRPAAERELRLLSVVVPVYNEEESLPALHARLTEVLDGLPLELVLVDDGSSDETPRLLAELEAADERIRVVWLSRNFGHQAALTAGLEHATGNAIVTIDADLQDPPEVILEMLERWRAGYDVITGVRHKRVGEPRWRLLAIRTFYRLYGRLARLEAYEANAGDYRMLSREALDALNGMPERNRYLRGMTAWIGFRRAAVIYERDARHAGSSKYPLGRLVRLAADGVLAFSVVPLRIASILGAVFSVLALLAIPIVFVLRLTGVYQVPGTASIHILVLFIGGLQLVTLGIIGEYLGRNYDETKRRPVYLVRRPLAAGETDEDADLERVGGGSAH